MKKTKILFTIGIGLQTIGGICTVAAVMGVMKEVKHQIRTAIEKELSPESRS